MVKTAWKSGEKPHFGTVWPPLWKILATPLTAIVLYYMAGSIKQDGTNPVLWLATQAGDMELFSPLRTTWHVPQEKFPQKAYNNSFIDQTYLVKMAWYWPHSFLRIYGPRLSLIPLSCKKKRELGWFPAILTSHLVNNPYILPKKTTQWPWPKPGP